jgi:serine phosphatase RsbU (regulator of sigma subunit)/CHASE2 domain-containing sensor protein
MGPFKRFRLPKLFPAGSNSSFESRRFQRSLAVGAVLTLIACLADQLGLLQSLDDWAYDVRAAHCQLFSSKPDDRIFHIDIDNAALEPMAIGRWPWSRATLARIVEEIGRAKPAAIALDIQLTEPERSLQGVLAAGTGDTDADDIAFEKCLAAQKNILLPVSFTLASADKTSSQQAAAVEELHGNLEMAFSEFLQRMRRRKFDFQNVSDAQDTYAHARSVATRQRVAEALAKTPLNDEQLIAQLLPHTDPAVQTPELNVLKHQASMYRDRADFRRFGMDVPALPLPTVPGEFDLLPLKSFADRATYCGYVNFDVFRSATLRSIPLMIESEHRMYPQLGLAMGCAVMGADVRKARVEATQIIIPRPDGSELHIPTHSIHSQSLNRDFSGIGDIPWFGGSEWVSMYDWPDHRRQVNHLSVNAVWEICETLDKIRTNQASCDRAVADLFGDAGNFKLDRAFAEKYARSVNQPDATNNRQAGATEALARLKESHLLEDFAAIPAAQLTGEEKEQFQQLKDAKRALEVSDANHALYQQLGDLRLNLASKLSGKGVLMGWTAEDEFDVVNTSIIARCPGVVVHGVIAQAVLSGRWWKRSPDWLGVILVLALGLAATVFVARLQPLRGFLASLLLVVAYLLINGFILFDASGWIVPVAGPIVAIGMVWSGCTLQRVISESIERNRVATEVAIINREMDLAHQVQAALIPKRPPAVPGLEAEGWTQPASTTGGDCYDLWQLSDGRLAILVADASGHGLAPAMIVSQVRTLVRAMSDLELHPHDLLRRINIRVAEDLEAGRFITVFLGFMSPDGLLEYASAGHGPQFWYDCDGFDLQLLDSTGAPLGCDTEWLCDDPLPPIQIAPGGTLAVFSDGIFEAVDPKGALFGIDRLKDILHTHRGQPGKTIIDLVIKAMLDWQKTPQPVDDQTVVIARRVALK